MALTQVSTGGIKDGQVQTADLADGQVTVSKLHADALDRTYTLGASGNNHYTFTGEGLTGAVNDPTLYLTRGKTYRFVNGNSAGAHPFRIQSTTGTSGTEYNTGVTNNAGGGGSTIIFEVPHAAPDVLYYQCTAHANMNGIFYVTGALADGTVTTAKLADEAVTLAKLEHGTSSNDGKFLRANNGGDPTFESLPASGATLSGSTDNTVVTVTGSNAMQGEAKLTFDGDKLTAKNSSGNAGIDLNVSSGTNPRLDFNTANVASSGIIKSEESGSGAIMEFHNKNSSGSEQQVITLTVDRNLQINDGNLVLASGHGIDFSASSNESGSTTELLDDYERGSFTAYWKFDPTNATGVTYTYNGGMYVKVGRMVYFTIHMWTSNKGSLASGSGWCQIEGLPFAVDGEGGFASISYYDNFGSYNPAVARVTPSEQIYIAQHNSGGYSQDLQHSHMNNSSRLHIGGCYATTY